MMRWTFIALALLVFASCARPTPIDNNAVATVPLRQCLAALDERQASYAQINAFSEGRGCGIRDGVAISHGLIALDETATLTCTTALAVDSFQREVVHPLALHYFGQPVVSMELWGSYACRGRTGNAGRLSEHAFGRAIDVAGFRLADGTMVMVTDWYRSTPGGAFLQAVARGACDHFSVVLTPVSDAAHRDHFHLDTGPWPLCEV
ncbi:MAG: extensin family protein [Pseudomonadota bacterium]